MRIISNFTLQLWLSIIGVQALAGADLRASATPDTPATVLRFSPTGEGVETEGVSVRFSSPMVPFGDPVLTAPFDITCPIPGKGRWIDEQTWGYQFETKPLPVGLVCTFSLKPGLKSLDAQTVTGETTFTLATGGPRIQKMIPEAGSSIHVDQAFILVLNTKVQAASLEKNLVFSVQGLKDPVGINVITGPERDELIKLNRNDLGLSEKHKTEADVVIIQAKTVFPEDTSVSLSWTKGIQTETGVKSDKEEVFTFHTRSGFAPSFRCVRENALSACSPAGYFVLQFGGPVPTALSKKIELRLASGRVINPDSNTNAGDETSTYDSVFSGPFPEDTQFTIVLPPDFHDDDGRVPLNLNSFPLTIRTGKFPPLVKFAAPFGIIEAKGNPALPVTLRYVEPELKGQAAHSAPGISGTVTAKTGKIPNDQFMDIIRWLRRSGSFAGDYDGHSAQVVQNSSIFGTDQLKATESMTVPRQNPFDVVGIPLKAPGFYVVELESQLLARLTWVAPLALTRTAYVRATALVTDLAVHFRWGHDSSLVWVTSLDSAKPVGGAMVTVRDCAGTVLAKGTSNAEGIFIPTGIPRENDAKKCNPLPGESWSNFDNDLFVTAELEGDMSFIHSGWQKGIESWRFGNIDTGYFEQQTDNTLVHTILDRSLVRAGDDVHLKHIIRRASGHGFEAIGSKQRPQKLVITHQGSGDAVELPLTWAKNGSAVNSWTVPKDAKLGSYTFRYVLGAKADAKEFGSSAALRVEEFRVPLMRGTIQGPSAPLVGSSVAKLDLAVQYLAGGGAPGLPVKLRWQVKPWANLNFDGYEGFTFEGGQIKEGTQRYGYSDENGEGGLARDGTSKLTTLDLKLDRSGTGVATLDNLPQIDRPSHLTTELEYRDPNGAVQTVAADFQIWPARRAIGLKARPYGDAAAPLPVTVVVVDLSGRGIPNTKATVDVFSIKTFSHRRRLVGGFYGYESVEETKRIGAFCAGMTDDKGLMTCTATLPGAGRYTLLASTTDGSGKAEARSSTWAMGQKDQWFGADDSDRMDLEPDKVRYESGDIAKIQIHMPFRQATVLVAIEREGVIETSVRTVDGKDPIVDIPIKDNFGPNVFVSMLAVRGRVDEPKATPILDLGKPAFKLGITKLIVGWQPYELHVKVTTDAPVYKTREKALVKIKVTGPKQAPLPAGSEVAVAAVDEGLLELQSNDTWDLLPAMMRPRPYELSTSTAQMFVVGKRHFGMKAFPQGGGGGGERQRTRELFDTLLFWQAAVPLNAEGEANLVVPLNDSISSFRITAIATGGQKLFGSGSTTIRSQRDLVLFSGLPPLVHSGDQLRATVTVRNATDAPLSVRVVGKITELSQSLDEQTIELAARAATEVTWPVTVPKDAAVLSYEFTAKATTGASDAIKVPQKVVPSVPVRPVQASLIQIQDKAQLSIERPKAATAGLGGIKVLLTPSILSGLGPVVDAMARYPYTCLEQQISMAVTTQDEKAWLRLMATLPSYIDQDGLLKFFPNLEEGSDTLTAYVLGIAAAAQYTIPENERSRLIEGLKSFVEGRVLRSTPWATPDLSLRKIAALAALARHDIDSSNAVAALSVQPARWPSATLVDWASMLKRWPKVPNRDALLKEAEALLTSRLSFQGSVATLTMMPSEHMGGLLSSADTAAVKLFLYCQEAGLLPQELPKIARGILARTKNGSWDLTIANAWGAVAIRQFAAAFEKDAVGGTTALTLADQSQTVAWDPPKMPKAVTLPWPQNDDELRLEHKGSGRPWAAIQSLAAIPRTEPFTAGFSVRKTWESVEQKTPGVWSRGDIARIKLEVTADSDTDWVALSDPIPAGAAILGTGLLDSRLLVQDEHTDDRNWPAYEERSHEGYRAYYSFVKKGVWSTEYTVRFNASGMFQLPPTRVEAMYFPEMLGELPNSALEIKE